MASQFESELLKSVLTLGVSVTTLGLGWFVGQRLTYRWNIRQKRKEAQLSISQQFYQAYGEFFAVWKLWNRLDPNGAFFSDRQWELQKRAVAAEATIEGILVKLSSEVQLQPHHIKTLGCYRQAFQQLRQSIRLGHVLPWTYSEDPPYVAFKKLASEVGALLSSEWPEQPPAPGSAAMQLEEITCNKWEPLWVAAAGQQAGVAEGAAPYSNTSSPVGS